MKPDPVTGLTAEQVYDDPPCRGEGCRWNMTPDDGCGLAKIGISVVEQLDGQIGRLCAARIATDSWIADGLFAPDPEDAP